MSAAFSQLGNLVGNWAATYLGAASVGTFLVTTLSYGTYSYLLHKSYQRFLDKGSGRRANSGLEVAINDTAAEGRAIYGCLRVGGIGKIPPITGGDDGRYLEQVLQ